MKGRTAIDTNVLVRILVRDEERQAGLAMELVRSVPVFIPKTVMIETAWVLESAYELPVTRIRQLLADLLAIDNVTVEDRGQVAEALIGWERGLDFADSLHLAASGDTVEMVTFDREFARRAARAGLAPPVRELAGRRT
jgi:predicted nucleic-acid-binding protein